MWIITDAAIDAVGDALDGIAEEIYVDGGAEWRPHFHAGVRVEGTWFHYTYPTEGGYYVTAYEDKLNRGLTGLDSGETEGRGPSVWLFVPGGTNNLSMVNYHTEEEYSVVQIDAVWSNWFDNEPVAPISSISWEEMELIESTLLAA